MGLVSVLADEDDLELLGALVDLVVLLHESSCESSAAWGPVSTEVESDELDARSGFGEGLLSGAFSENGSSNNVFHFSKIDFCEKLYYKSEIILTK